MSGTVGNIIARVGADVSPLAESMKEAQNTILTFKDESLAALKSFGLPHISSTNLVEAIQAGQRVVVNFAQESGESLAQFQQRVRTTFAEAGIDITEYEKVLTDADKVHAEFAKGAVKSFQAVSAAAEEVNNKAEEIRSSLGSSFSGIQANFGAFKDSVVNVFKTMTDGSASFGEKIGAVSNAVVDGFGLMTGAIEIFIAVEVVKKVGEWIDALKELASETQDAEHRFYASTGSMSDAAEEFSKNLAESYGIDQETIQGMMAKEYTNTRMLGFDPTQAEGMSEHITQLSYDLGKLRGIDPSQVFDALSRGIEGQTRGLMDLGIRITTTDLKNKALSEGLIKQGQTMTDAQTSAVAYQMIMEKLQGTTGYYKSTADDLSTQQAKLNAGWEEMKRKLAEDLTPAFTGLMQVVSFVATGFEQLVEVIGTAIQYISLFVEDTYSAVKDVMSMDFGAINADWANNYASIFNSSQAAKDYGNSMDSATSAANAQNNAQKALNKSVNANTMSFDQLHNITNSGAAAANVQTDAVHNLAKALENLKGMDSITNNQSKGMVIPVSFKVPPIPPIPPIQPPPPVLETWTAAAATALAAWAVTTTATLGGWETAMELGLATWTSTTEATLAGWVTLTESAIAGWSTLTELGIATWATVTEATLAAWAVATELIISPWAIATEAIFVGWELVTNLGLGKWAVTAGKTLESWAQSSELTIEGWGKQFETGFSQALNVTETMVEGWATKVAQGFKTAIGSALADIASLAGEAGKTLSNVGNSIGNWASNNKTLLAGAGIAGLTIASGGADLVVGGIAAAGEALAGIGAGLGTAALAGVSRFATGGVVTSPTLGVFGEAGPEAVIPLDQLGSMVSNNSNSSGGNGGGSASSQPINVTLRLDGRTLARTLYQYTTNEADRLGKNIGYDTSYNYPK